MSNNGSILLLILFVWAAFVQANEVNGSAGKSGNYKQQLRGLELIRKSQTDKFSNTLINLKSKVDQMNHDERCYYDYLVVYKDSFKGDYAQSVSDLETLKKTCLKDEYQARIAQFLANLQVIIGDFEPAINNLNQAIQITDQSEDSYLISMSYIVAAISYRLMGQDEIALKYAELLIKGDFSEDDVCMGEFNKYRILMRQGKGSEQKNEIMTAINRCESLNNYIASLFLRFDQIRYQFTDKVDINMLEAQQAVSLLESMSETVEMTQFKNIKVYYHALLSHMYWLTGMNNEAKNYALLTLEENNSIGESEQLILVLNVLINLSLEEQAIQPAYDYLAQKNEVEKQVYERKLATQVAYYRVMHANLAQELEIEQLNQNNQVLELKNKLAKETSHKQQLLTLMVLVGFLLLGFWTYKIKRRHDYFKDVSEVDHLTQVFTRKAFEEQLLQIIKTNKDKSEPVNIAILDLDHFKDVNDKYGHLVGDWVLQNIIIACEEVIDQDALIARIGGEEFAIVTPSISLQKTLILLEKMRSAIENLDCSPTGHQFNVTASFGVTSSLTSGLNKAMLMTHADVALFQAKNNGRNQVVAYKL